MKLIPNRICFQTVVVRNELCQVKFTSPRGPLYHRDCGGDNENGTICAEPLLPDPYETQYCYVRSSRIKGGLGYFVTFA